MQCWQALMQQGQLPHPQCTTGWVLCSMPLGPQKPVYASGAVPGAGVKGEGGEMGSSEKPCVGRQARDQRTHPVRGSV